MFMHPKIAKEIIKSLGSSLLMNIKSKAKKTGFEKEISQRFS